MQVKSIAIAECSKHSAKLSICILGRSKVLQNAPKEHSAKLSICSMLPSVFKTFALPIFEWPLKTGLTVVSPEPSASKVGTNMKAQTKV